jgi:S1/P1 Nuclease.
VGLSGKVSGMSHAASVSRHPARGRHARLPALLSGLAALAFALPVQAWSALGHRLVARLAEDGLTPEARATAALLLEGEPRPTLAGVASWADELRGADDGLGRRTARWHFVNMGEDGCRYDAARHCADGDCVVAALEAQARILADRDRPREERRQALKFVVHLVGDVHQPMHAGNGHDRGGNRFQVNLHGRGTNLHALWDSGMLDTLGLDEEAWLERLRQRPAPAVAAVAAAAPLPPETARAWAEHSCRIATAPGAYPDGHVVGEDYIQAHLPLLEAQLRLAGARLAEVLNAALGDG